MAAEPVEFAIKVGGAEEASRSFKRVGDAIKNTSEKTGALNRINEDSQRRLNGLRQVAFGVGDALGRLDPQIDKVVQGLSSVAAGAIQGAAAFGPWGAAVGGLTAALPLLVSALSDTSAGMTETARAARELTNDLDAAIRQIQRMDAASDFQRRRQLGQLTFDEARALALQARTSRGLSVGQFNRFLEQRFAASGASRLRDSLFAPASRGDVAEVRRRIAAATGAQEGSDVFEGIDTLVESLARSFRDVESAEGVADAAGRRQADRAVAESRRTTNETIERITRPRGGGGGGRDSGASLARELLAIKREQMEIEAKLLETQLQQVRVLGDLKTKNEELLEAERAATEARGEKMHELAEQDREFAREAIERMRFRWNHEGDLAQEQADREKQIAAERKEIADAAIGLAEQGAAVVAEAFNLAEGPKAAISAALEVAKAVSDFASFNYVGGAGHLLSATLFWIQAAKMGFAADSGGGVARPIAPTNQPPQQQGPTTINFNAPFSEADVGVMQRRFERAAHSRFDS